MPIYKIQAPDGNIYRIEGPAGANPEDLFRTVAEQRPMAAKTTEELQAEKSAPTSISDLARTAGSSFVGAGKSLVDVFGAGSDISSYLGDVAQKLEQGKTPERLAEMARRAELSKRAEKEGTWAQIKSGLAGVAEAPLESVVGGVFSSAPTIAAGAAALAALPASAPAAIAVGVQRASRILMSAAQGTGEVKGDIHESIKNAYKEKNPNMPPEEVERLATEAQAYTLKNAPLLIGGAAFGAIDAVTGFEKSTSQALKNALSPNKTAFTKEGLQSAIANLPKKAVEAPTYLGQAVKTGIGESIPEGLQGGYGQLAQNVAMSQAGFETPTFQGVAGAAARDALVGALTGTAMSPLSHSVANAEFQADKYLRGVQAQQQFDKEREEFAKTQEQTKENLGVNKTLMLGYEPPAEEEKYTNPAATIKKNELMADEVKFVDTYRKQNGLPPLKSYSIEDIKDAMPNVDPAGEQGRIDSILAAKYGYKPVDDNTGKPVNYTADDVISAAEDEKNVATGTKGFNDFLTRTTGSSDLNTMTQPQLFAAYSAIKQMPESTEKVILPEGTGASRFTDKQYKKAVSWFGQTFESVDNKPLSRDTIIGDIQEATGLEQKQDAEALLDTAVKNGDLAETEERVFRTYDANDKLVSTYRDKEKAAAAAKKQGLNVREETLRQMMPPPAAEPAKRANLPEGYAMSKETIKEGEVPVGFDIFPEGKGKALFTVPTSEAVQEKIDQLIPARKKEAARYLSYMDRDKATLQKARDSLVSMEARGEVGSQAYELAKTKLAKQERVLGNRILKSMERITDYEQPLISRPSEKKKQITREKITVTKQGKFLGSFPDNVKAQEAILVQMSDQELADTASDGRLGAIADRAAKEIERRKSPTGIMVRRTPKAKEELPPLSPELTAVADEISKKLVPILQRMGLGDVGFKIVQSIKNGGEGSYTKNLIQLAIDAEKPLEVMHHESLHALKDLGFFTPQQWSTLENQAQKSWITKYLKNVQVEVEIDGVKQTMSRYDAYVALKYTPEDIVEEAIADAFADFATSKPPGGMIASIMKRLNDLFKAIKNAFNRSGFESAEDIFTKAQRGELKPSNWKATPEVKAQADAYDQQNGILPYTSEGQIKIPLEGEGQKLSLKKAYSEKDVAREQRKQEAGKKFKVLKNDPITGLPLNQDGTVTLYYPTTNEGARELARTKKLVGHSPTANRIYLTNESSAPEVAKNPSMIEQPLGGANVMLQIDPSFLHPLEDHDKSGRRDFFIPIAEGQAFANKARLTKLFTLDAPRTKGLHPDRTLAQVQDAITDTVAKWKNASAQERRLMASQAKATLIAQHNVTRLFGANSKLEKTNIGDYGLTFNGKKVMSTGLGFASAQKINDQQLASTCPKSAICEALCLGETSGQNLLYGGEGEFRSGPRLSQYLKTEALIVNPEAFTVAMIRQIEAFRNAAKAAGKEDGEAGYQPAIRLNVTSDFKPATFEAIINMFPDVMFYDYTKLETKPIAPNHHLTYSSTGASQVVGNKVIYNKESNWDNMVKKFLSNGKNVAMAFTSRNAMPKFVMDERTGKTFEVWNGDEYDARFLDPSREDGAGLIIGLTNKDNTTKPEDAAEKHKGFFLDYDPARDGDTLIIRNQDSLKPGAPVEFKRKEKLSLRSARGMFEDGLIQEVPNYKGREKVIELPIKDFLRLAQEGEVKGKQSDIEDLFKAGTKLNSLPLLMAYNNQKGDLKVQGHEGRHRARALLGQGYDTMPVRFLTSIRWSEQNDPTNFDYEKNWPSKVISEDSDDISIPMPVSREQSMEPYSSEKLSLRKAPDTPAFKRWFGKSKIVNPDGTPKVMYHGTSRDIGAFKPKQAGAIFLTDDSDFAARFSQRSTDFMLNEIAKGIDSKPDEKRALITRLVDDAVANKKLATKENSNGLFDTTREEHIEEFMNRPLSQSMGTVGIGNALTQELSDRMPSGQNIMPVYVKAENTFDYENPRHIKKIIDHFTEIDNDDITWLKAGNWETIESEGVQDAIQFAGFDSFYVKEHGRKNLAVYEPTQIKSATGNQGTFDINEPDVRLSLKKVNELFDKAEDIPESEGVEIIRSNWIGGVSGIGERDSAYDLYRVNGGKKYMSAVQDLVRKELGDNFKGYRLMHTDELEEIQTGAMGSQLASFTLRHDIAQSFANLATYSKVPKDKLKVVEMDLTPEHVWMVGHPAEQELVIDYGQGYNPSAVTEYKEKLSLRSLMPDLRSQRQPPDSKEFKQWFTGSYFTSNGEPLIMYHGTARDITIFRGKQAKAIFITTNPVVAENYTGMGEDYMRAEAYKALTRDEKAELISVVAEQAERDGTINKDELKEIQKNLKKRVPDLKNLPYQIEGEIIESLNNLLPTRGNIMPVYVNAKNVFDYANPNDVNLVMDRLTNYSKTLGKKENPEQYLAAVKGMISRGNWPRIESPEVQEAIRGAGFDGFSVLEAGTKNYAVYNPTAIKSVTGNIGTYGLGEVSTEQAAQFGMTAEQARQAQAEGDIRLSLKKVPVGIPDNVWNLHNRYQEAQGNVAEGEMVSQRKTAATKAFKRLSDAAEAYTGNEQDALKLMQEMNAISGIRQAMAEDDKSALDTYKVMSPALWRQETREKLSLRAATAPAMNAAIDRTTFVREEKGFVERLMEAISPQSWSDFRAKALNRYNAMSVADKKRAQKMGGAALLADQSAESAALMSDLSAGVTASVLGVHDRNGGAPVFRNGVTTVDGSIKGPVAIFAPLARYGDPRIYQMWQFYAGAKRARRYFKDGKEQNYTPSDMAYADQLGQQYPEFKQIFDEWNAFNNALVQYQVDTGVLSKERADEYRKYSDYLPFYRQLEDEATLGPKVFQSISGVKGPKKLKGSEAPIADLMETIVRNVQSGIQAGMKNTAAQRAIKVFEDIGEAVPTHPTDTGPSTVYALVNGEKKAYIVADHALYNSMQSLNLPELPFLGFFAGPANLLRNLVTKDPGFMLANMVRDSMSAWVTSGVSMTPVASAVKNFTGALRGTAPEYQALLNAGILGGYEFSQNVEASGKQLSKELAKYGPTTTFGKITKPFTSLWGALEKGTTASDAATRMEVYKNVLAETGNEAEALYRALEVMNFNRKGNSAVVRILTAAVPFLNARMQGLDVLYRASFGQMATQDAKAIQKSFFIRGATIMAMSMMYWALTHDEEDYMKQEQETRDNYWLIPSLGIKIPIPFEVGVIFKVIPERIAEYAFGNDTGKDFADAMKRNFTNTFAFNPIPQTILPLVEARTDHSFFTGRAILSKGLEGVAPEYQIGPNTSRMAQFFASLTSGMTALPDFLRSPAMIDHIIGGYTGTFGMYAVDAVDAIVSANSDVPKASKRFEQMPVLRRFLLDPEARGNVTAYYDLKNATDEVVRTSNFLERTMNFENFADYSQDTIKMLASADFVKSMDKDMKELNDVIGVIRNSSMSSDEKRDALLSLNQAQNNLTANIKLIKKSLD